MNKEIIFDYESTIESADPVIANLKRKANSSQNLQQMINRTPVFNAGQRTKEELDELKNNIKQYIVDGLYTYWQMEQQLKVFGYNEFDIRKMFKELTGLDAKLVFDISFNTFIKSPATIPPLNLGWGECKNKKYDYAFIMPYKNGYAIFGQKGDLQRDEINFFATVEDAREKIKNIVKDVYTFDEKLNEKILKKKADNENFEEITSSLSDEAISLHLEFIRNQHNEKDIINILNSKFELNQITSDDYNVLIKAYAKRYCKYASLSQTTVAYIGKDKEIIYDTKLISNKYNLRKGSLGTVIEVISPEYVKVKWIESSPTIFSEHAKDLCLENNYVIGSLIPLVAEEEEKDDTSIELEPTSVKQEKEEITPQKFFEAQRDVPHVIDSPEHIKKVLEYLKNKSDELEEFNIDVKSFKYMKEEMEQILQDTPVAQEAVPFFSSAAIISILVTITDTTISTEKNSKDALIVFFVKDDDIVTTDTLKAEDDKIYSFSYEGLKSMFLKERGIIG